MSKIYITLVLIIFSTYAESQIAPTNSPYYNNGSYTVVSDSNLTDLNKPLLFYYPQTTGTYPVLMFQLGANGFGSSVINRHTYDLFVQHLASYGFVVIVIDDSQAGLPNGASFIETHDWFKNKVIDPNHWLSSYADPNQLVIGGHSNGGVNASALLVDRPTEIEGIIFMDSYPSGGVLGFGAHDVSAYSGKVLTLSANENDPTANKEGWDKFTSSECKTYVDISGLDHGGFGDYILASQPVGPIGRTDATATIRHFLVSWMLSEYSADNQAANQLKDELLHPSTVQEFVNDCGTITVSLTQEGLENIKVFPNPSNGKFTVKGYDKNNGVIEVIDAMGRSIKSINITSTSTIVDLQEYLKGIYFFKVIQNNNELIYKVIIN